jgi:hypothetical protein
MCDVRMQVCVPVLCVYACPNLCATPATVYVRMHVCGCVQCVSVCMCAYVHEKSLCLRRGGAWWFSALSANVIGDVKLLINFNLQMKQPTILTTPECLFTK